jgi:hypothetical protein
MISTPLARALADSGLVWHPISGDRFVIDRPEVDGDVFTVSEMTVEAHHYPTGTVLGFNGTTEWALDSVDQTDALWLPREDQLRALLAGTFRSLRREDEFEYVVETSRGGEGGEHRGITPADAYGRALLAYLAQTIDEPAPDEPAPDQLR